MLALRRIAAPNGWLVRVPDRPGNGRTLMKLLLTCAQNPVEAWMDAFEIRCGSLLRRRTRVDVFS